MHKLCCLALAAGVLAVAAGGTMADPPATTAKGQKGNPDLVFKRIDTDGDGKLSREEFRAFIEKASKGKLADKPELIDKLFERLDTNGDGYLSPAEFKKLRDLREKLAAKQRAKKASDSGAAKQ